MKLDYLQNDDFVAAYSAISTPSALRRALSRSDEVTSVRDGLRSGGITEETIRRFVAQLMRGYRPDQHFTNEISLAALAVVLERRATDFAEEFLCDLARLKLAEMPLAIRVARESLLARGSLARNRTKHFRIARLRQRIVHRELSAQRKTTAQAQIDRFRKPLVA